MANIKSSEKRNRLIKKAYARNKSSRTFLKSSLKKFDAAVVEGNKESAEAAYKVAVKTVDKAAAKNLIHKNNAARKKSSLTRSLNAMSAK